MIVYDYLDGRGVNLIKEWTMTLGTRDRARLNNKLDRLGDVKDALQELPGLLFGPGIDGHREIWKLRIGGSGSGNALRPLLCKGPFNKRTEITLLAGAVEKDGTLEPHGVAATAEQRRQDILNNAGRRRTHERVINERRGTKAGD
jgi:hypothetical protein